MGRFLLIAAATLVATFLCEASVHASVVSDWNAAALAEVRLSKALRNGPPMVARALAIAHTCMYDAWAAYDDLPGGLQIKAGREYRYLVEPLHFDLNAVPISSDPRLRCRYRDA